MSGMSIVSKTSIPPISCHTKLKKDPLQKVLLMLPSFNPVFQFLRNHKMLKTDKMPKTDPPISRPPWDPRSMVSSRCCFCSCQWKDAESLKQQSKKQHVLHVPVERNCVRLRFSHWTLGVPLMQRYVVAKNQQIKRHFDGRWCQLRNKQLSQYTVAHVFTYLQSPGYCWINHLVTVTLNPQGVIYTRSFGTLGYPNHDTSPHGRSKSKLRHHSYRCTNANVWKDQHERSWRYCMSCSYSK